MGTRLDSVEQILKDAQAFQRVYGARLAADASSFLFSEDTTDEQILEKVREQLQDKSKVIRQCEIDYHRACHKAGITVALSPRDIHHFILKSEIRAALSEERQFREKLDAEPPELSRPSPAKEFLDKLDLLTFNPTIEAYVKQLEQHDITRGQIDGSALTDSKELHRSDGIHTDAFMDEGPFQIVLNRQLDLEAHIREQFLLLQLEHVIKERIAKKAKGMGEQLEKVAAFGDQLVDAEAQAAEAENQQQGNAVGDADTASSSSDSSTEASDVPALALWALKNKAKELVGLIKNPLPTYDEKLDIARLTTEITNLTTNVFNKAWLGITTAANSGITAATAAQVGLMPASFALAGLALLFSLYQIKRTQDAIQNNEASLVASLNQICKVLYGKDMDRQSHKVLKSISDEDMIDILKNPKKHIESDNLEHRHFAQKVLELSETHPELYKASVNKVKDHQLNRVELNYSLKRSKLTAASASTVLTIGIIAATVATGPIGLVAAGIGLLVGLCAYAWNRFRQGKKEAAEKNDIQTDYDQALKETTSDEVEVTVSAKEGEMALPEVSESFRSAKEKFRALLRERSQSAITDSRSNDEEREIDIEQDVRPRSSTL